MEKLIVQYEKEKIFKDESVEQPYLEEATVRITQRYNPNYGDDRECKCGHAYYRHFDSYEDMDAIGCKYCRCYEFKEK